MNRILRSFLVVALVAGISSWGNQSTVEEAKSSEVARDESGSTTATHPFDDNTLLFFERTLPAIHQLLATDEWQYVDGFAKYRLVAPRLLRHWGAEDPYESLTSLKELEQNSPGLAASLERSSVHLLFHYANSERFHEFQNKVLSAYADAVQNAADSQTEHLAAIDDLSTCLTNVVSSEHRNLLITERRYRRSLSACVDPSDELGTSNFSTSPCPFATTSTLFTELDTLLTLAANSAVDCWGTEKRQDEMVEKSSSNPELQREDND